MGACEEEMRRARVGKWVGGWMERYRALRLGLQGAPAGRAERACVRAEHVCAVARRGHDVRSSCLMYTDGMWA